MPIRPGPLNGIKVIELAGIGPGPYAGQLLADYGADVVVVDRPGGGMLKAIDGRGKRSIVLDLKKPDAVAALLKLVASADVLIEGLPRRYRADGGGARGVPCAQPAADL